MEQDKNFTVTAGAFTKARKKLKHTAYLELNHDIIRLYYDDEQNKRYRGYRLVAFDGSKIILPKTPEIVAHFGDRNIANKEHETLGSYANAMYQCGYDVLNHIAIFSTLTRGDTYEVDLASDFLDQMSETDLAIYDRGYASYIMMARLRQRRLPFIIRCPKTSFAAVRAMFDEDAPDDFTVLIDVPKKHKALIKQEELPSRIKIRLIRVVLTSGEVEVLATSIFDEEQFSVSDFYYLYGLRWGVETFFSKIKGRLGLENFTGKTVEAVLQDFWSTIFLSNLETVITEDIEQEVNEQKSADKKTVKLNKAVCFNVIKHNAFELLLMETDKQQLLEKLKNLFLMNTLVVRNNRPAVREKISTTRSFNFQKRARKHVF